MRPGEEETYVTSAARGRSGRSEGSRGAVGLSVLLGRRGSALCHTRHGCCARGGERLPFLPPDLTGSWREGEGSVGL